MSPTTPRPDPIGTPKRRPSAQLDAAGVDCLYFPSFEEIEDYLKKNSIDGDLLITMGAGNVVQIGEDLLR